jgi:hypothetical protein
MSERAELVRNSALMSSTEQRAVSVDLAQLVFDTLVDTMELTVAEALDELRRRLKARGLKSDNEAVCQALRSIDPSLERVGKRDNAPLTNRG